MLDHVALSHVTLPALHSLGLFSSLALLSVKLSLLARRHAAPRVRRRAFHAGFRLFRLLAAAAAAATPGGLGAVTGSATHNGARARLPAAAVATAAVASATATTATIAARRALPLAQVRPWLARDRRVRPTFATVLLLLTTAGGPLVARRLLGRLLRHVDRLRVPSPPFRRAPPRVALLLGGRRLPPPTLLFILYTINL